MMSTEAGMDNGGNGEEMVYRRLERSAPVDKHAFLAELCRGKKVLDLGCADYPMTRRRLERGELLFARLAESAAELTGVDLDERGVRALREAGFDNVMVGDVEKLGELGLEGGYQVIVAGELLEHLSCPGRFLEQVTALMAPESLLVITVPNAFALKRFLRVLTGCELVNKDHVCYFSPGTVEELCGRFDLEVTDYRYFLAEVEGGLKRLLFLPLKAFVRRLCPFVADHLIFLCRLAPGTATRTT